ncbi:MAG: hypothetical protein LAT62_00710 [Natronospirillum sp.]|uniref:YCF48-related protein n=1 Tax=Natronospirillum sp. TaxID=2812955 RepID=UPI0025CD6690|nr:YCF48-related protein [Natronospirillum sp.]MCH8550423.1 hypothetical protein [Natronospirillum sp.]
MNGFKSHSWPAALLLASLALYGCNSSSSSSSDENGSADGSGSGSGGGTTGTPPQSAVIWAHPKPQGYSLNALVEHNSRLIAAGDRGTVMVSTDGQEWSIVETAPTSLRGLATNGQTLVAVGGSTGASSGGRAFYSEDDGATWSSADIDEAIGGLNTVTWTGNHFIALGVQAEAHLSSTDGKNWTKVESGPTLPTAAIAANGGRLVAGSRHHIYLSEDGGGVWTREASVTSGANSNITDVHFNGDEFAVAGGFNQWGFRSSTNGKSWSSEDDDFDYSFGLPGRLKALVFAEDQYWFTDTNGRIHKRAADEPTWEEVANPQNQELNAIIHSSQGFIAVGNNGAIVSSDDGSSWSNDRETFLTANNWAGMATNDSGRMVAISENGYAVYSDDGDDWSEVALTGTPFLTDIAWTGTRFVVSGTNTVAHSTDGESWTVVDPRTNTASNLFLSHVGGLDNSWVALVGNNLANDQVALCTPSGCSMGEAPDASRSLVATEDGYVVVSFSGWARTSADGDEWTTTERALSTTNMGFVRLSAMGNTVVVSSPSNSHLHTAYSTDGGKTWSAAEFPEDESVTAAAAFNDGNRFYIKDDTRSRLWISDDGSSWEAKEMRHPVRGLARKGEDLYILGAGNHLLKVSLP